MKILYADELLLLNTATDYLLLLMTSTLCGRYAPRWRLLLASLTGGGYSLAAVLCGGFFAGALCWLSVSVGMVALAFFPGKDLFKMTGLFLFSAFLLGGGAYCLQLILARPGGLSLSVEAMLLLFPLFYLMTRLLVGNLSRNRKGGGIIPVCLTAEGKTVHFSALVDTGNALRDPVTGKAVLIAEMSALKALALVQTVERGRKENPYDTLANLQDTDCAARLRLIPYRSLGRKDGMLLCFRPDTLMADGKMRDDLLVALTWEPLSDGGPFQAIIGV